MNRRFWSSYAFALGAFSALLGAATAAASLSAGPAGSRIVVSLLRASAPMAAGSALLLALTLWSEALPQVSLPRELDRATKQALALALPGYFFAALLAVGANFAVAAVAGVPSRPLGAALAQVARQDLGVGLGCTLLDTGLIVLLARRFAVRLRATNASLPAKLIVIVTVTVPLRATLALLCAPFLPG